MCTCNIKNDNYPLETETPLTEHSSQLIAGEVLALAANAVEHQIELFAGVELFGEFSVEKVRLVQSYHRFLSTKY